MTPNPDFLAYQVCPAKIPTRSGLAYPDLQYCNGWSDFENMGIACVGLAWSNGSTAVIVPDTDAMKLILVDILWPPKLLVGFNSNRFGDTLLWHSNIRQKDDFGEDSAIASIDLLKLIRMAAYGSDSHYDQPSGHKYSMAAIAGANGLSKLGIDSQVPEKWQRGERTFVMQHALRDACIIRKLFQLGLAGELVDPNTQEALTLSL